LGSIPLVIIRHTDFPFFGDQEMGVTLDAHQYVTGRGCALFRPLSIAFFGFVGAGREPPAEAAEAGESVAGAGPTKDRPRDFVPRSGVPFGGGVAPGAGAGGVMAQTWNQYWVPLVRPVTVQIEALPT